jgi:hypothetical protein
LAALFVAVSCSPSYRFTITSPDAANYQVDVARWFERVVGQESTWTFATTDAFISINASYVPAGGATGSQVPYVHLNGCTVAWNAGAERIPSISVPLSINVPGDSTGNVSTQFDVLIIPAITKDTCAALVALRADPAHGIFTNGRLSATGILTVTGTNLSNGDSVGASLPINATFADFPDSLDAH